MQRHPIVDVNKDKKVFSSTAANIHPKNMEQLNYVKRGGIRL